MSLIMFLTFIFLSILLIASSPSWLMIWLGLELNSLSFLPFAISLGMKKSQCMKYFSPQALGSLTLLLSAYTPFLFSKTLITSALMLKLGIFPLYFWLPPLISSLKWKTTFLILTLQKIPALLTLSLIFNLYSNVSLLIISNAFFSSFLMINQLSLRKFLLFSSMFNTSWIILAMEMNNNLWIFYFLVYSFILFYFIMLLSSSNMYFSSFSNLSNNNMSLSMILFSFMSFPPLLSFSTKMLILMNISNLFYTFLMIITSSISIFAYFLMGKKFFSVFFNSKVISFWFFCLLTFFLGILFIPFFFI